ncbi:MAG TPA: diiron oxygenase [Kofleriaceae bacterium]|nr:diiron oxygenase [Kofleriaceae bacterium]
MNAAASPPRRRPLDELVPILNRASIEKSYVPLRDIAWDAPEMALVPGDPRLALPPHAALAQTAWYRALDAATQSALGLRVLVQTLAYGVSFESVLSRGLLELAAALPQGSPLFRYALHEVCEEAHHSMMFRELIDRAGVPVDPLPRLDAMLDPYVIRSGRTFPTLFFFAVWGGELFVDADNRAMLRHRDRLHPLVAEILRIHVTEEARHLSFAASYLDEHLPRLGRARRAALGYAVPLTLAGPLRLMLQPSRGVVADFAIPDAVLAEAFGPDSEHRRRVIAIAEPVRRTCEAHGLYERRHVAAWRWFGLA